MEQIKKKLNAAMLKCFPQDKKKRRMRIVEIILVLLVVAVIIALAVRSKISKERGELSQIPTIPTQTESSQATTLTESGSVDIGITTQSFELDISEFTGTSSFSFGGSQMQGAGSGMGGFPSMGGGTDPMASLFSGQAQSSSDSGSERQLEIEEIYIEVGQEIKEGDPVLKLTGKTVESIRTELSEDVSEAKLVYDQAMTAGKQSDTEAESTYKTNTLYGTYAQTEYDQTVGALEDAVTLAEEALAETGENLAKAQTKLAETEVLLTEQKKVLENAEYTEQTTDKENNLYWWLVAYQTVIDAKALVESLEEEIESLKEDIEAYTQQQKEDNIALLLAQKDLESGKITAEGELDKRIYNAENAQEIHDVVIEQSTFDIENAKEDYDAADEKLKEFDSVIKEQIIYATGNGVVTEVFVASGDELTQNMEIFSINNYDEVTITLSIAEEDMHLAQLGSKADITVAAFPEETFTGVVTEIGDAEIDSNTNKIMYTVIVTIENKGNLLYQDMTAEVTFKKEGENQEIKKDLSKEDFSKKRKAED